MTEPQHIPWKRIGVEAVAIVASILVAFALDAWWAEKQLENEIAEDLAIVEYELAENIRLVKLAVDTMNRAVTANNTLVATLQAHAESTTVEVPTALVFWSIFMNPTLDPSLGGTDAWIAAGRLGSIESPVLRQRLASVRGKFEDVIEEQRDARDIGIRQIYPLIQDNIGDIGPINQLFADGLHARQGKPVSEVSDAGTMSFPNSDALRFTLQARTLWYEASIKESLDFQVELEQIQVLVSEEVNGTGRVTIEPTGE